MMKQMIQQNFNLSFPTALKVCKQRQLKRLATGWKRLLKVASLLTIEPIYENYCQTSFFVPSACAKWHPSSPMEESYCESGQAAKPDEEEVASKATQLPDPVLAKDEQSTHK